MIDTLFWILLAVIFYTYFGYTMLLLIFLGFKKFFIKNSCKPKKLDNYPEVTILIAAYNEKQIVALKMENTYNIEYPKEKLKILWVTDGSNDGTPEILKEYNDVTVLHEEVRNGKTAAMNRAMSVVKTPYVVFCDANTMLNKLAIKNLIIRFSCDKIGCVAGEKRISEEYSGKASGVGEGTYWKYESFTKKVESDLYSTLGAAGELYAIRTDLFEIVDNDIIIDDFVNSLQIALKGYHIKYAPDAYATEAPSLNIEEELKRKVRIASGGFQVMGRIPGLFNIFKSGFLSFEFISHKVFRWAVVPFAIPLVFILNFWICIHSGWHLPLYNYILGLQVLFYLFVLIGCLGNQKLKSLQFLFIPYYLIVMNYAQIAGLFRFISRKHSVVWEKVKRS